MTRYTQLRHAGYYQPNLSDKERQQIADEVDSADAPKASPRQSTTSQSVSATPKRAKRSSK